MPNAANAKCRKEIADDKISDVIRLMIYVILLHVFVVGLCIPRGDHGYTAW